MRNIRIAFIEQDSGIGGAEVNLFYLFEGMNRELISPVVIVPFEGPLTEHLKEMKIEYRVIRQFKFFSTSTYILGKKIFNPFAILYDIFIFLPTIWSLKNFLKEEKINLVHTNSMLAHIYGAIAAKLAGIPCIWHMQDIVDQKMVVGLARRAVVFLGRILPKKIVVVSKAVGQMFEGKSVQKVQIVYNGTDINKFSTEIDGSGIRKEFKIADDEFAVGIVGRLVIWKGQGAFLKAASIILSKIPNTKFLIIGETTFGDKKYKDDLYKLTCELGIESKVIFLGYRDDVPNIIRAMDILVHASLKPEPFGLVIIEGMASGIPVVASNQGGTLEIIEHGKDGFLVNPEETDTLAKRIIELLRDRSLRSKFAEAARKKVVEQFSINNFTSEFQKIYLEVLN
jgi:glycosyltransferase involved in cell wall biosynthesis